MTAGDVVEWDVFVSYNKADRKWAEWIAWQLEDRGWRVLVEAWDFVPGSSWADAMEEGVRRAKRMLLVMSPDYLGSVYGKAEWEVVWASDPLGRLRKLLPVRVRECGRSGFLGQVVGVDLFDTAEDEARQRLLDAVQAAVEGRSKPSSPPPFPGPDTSPPFPPAT
jgi:hypothetical protein